MKHKKTAVAILIILIVLSSFILGVKAAWMFAYTRSKFNCVDMSYKFAPIFHNLGFDTKVIYGSNNETAHCWLSINGVYWDATSLWFNNQEKYPSIDYVDSYPYD